MSDDSSSLSTRDKGDCSDASQDLTSMAEGDLGDLEDNQPDSSAPEDEQTDHSTQQPIGKLCSTVLTFIPLYAVWFLTRGLTLTLDATIYPGKKNTNLSVSKLSSPEWTAVSLCSKEIDV